MGGLEGMLLFVTSRIAEFAGIIITIFLLFKGYKARYVYLVGIIVLLSIVISLFSLYFKEYFLQLAIGDIVLTLLLLLGISFYVVRNPEKTRDFTPPDDARCLYCNAYITREESLCLLRINNRTFYFDSFDHLVKLMRESDYFLERGDLPRGKVHEIFVKTADTGNWKAFEKVVPSMNGDELVALEKGSSKEDLKELLESFKNRVSGN